jgi:hypothetical protein
MSDCYIQDAVSTFYPEPDKNVMASIFKQYESVIIESLITSFGLDFLINDLYGGDVDTILNVRKVEKDDQMIYKNKKNNENYKNQEKYDSRVYHSHNQYIEKNRDISQKKGSGLLYDSYTGKKIKSNEKSDLDHVISAKEIHDDAGRVLAGLKGTELANANENLEATNPRTNRTKKADSMNDFIEKYGDEYTDAQKENMLQKDSQARKVYEQKIAKAYYTSERFAKDVVVASGKVGIKMGTRQVLGFIFMELWFAVKQEFEKTNDQFDFGKMLTAVGNGIKRGYENAKVKYQEMITKFFDGALAGMLSSLTTTLCNIFITTSKNVVKIIRQIYVPMVQATKILFINPDNLSFGERMRAVIKILSIGASVVVGGLISEAIGKTPICSVYMIGDIVKTFCGTLVTGIMSCTLLYFFDRSEIVNKFIKALNKFQTISDEVNYFYRQALYFDTYAADLMKIDLEKFRKETEIYNNFSLEIENAKSDMEINMLLKKNLVLIGLKLPWEGDFNSFMGNKKSFMVFE